jgi:hypothetical protein
MLHSTRSCSKLRVTTASTGAPSPSSGADVAGVPLMSQDEHAQARIAAPSPTPGFHAVRGWRHLADEVARLVQHGEKRRRCGREAIKRRRRRCRQALRRVGERLHGETCSALHHKQGTGHDANTPHNMQRVPYTGRCGRPGPARATMQMRHLAYRMNHGGRITTRHDTQRCVRACSRACSTNADWDSRPMRNAK